MRKFLIILSLLILAGSLSAQVRTGNIYGTVVDTDGNALPGVAITLTGSLTAPVSSISSAEGVFRFLALAPASDYTLKAELEGFKTEIQENIIVAIGANVEVTLLMELGAIQEEVTVTAETPVIDTKRTTVGENVTRDVLQSLPSARDPWVVLQQAPGIYVDRENVGGSESGQQAGFQARGGGSNQWAMDGVVITDPSSISSPIYYDFDAFEEMNVTTGGSDVSVQTGGIQMNLVTRRGGNRISIGGRFYLTDKKFQSENLQEEHIAEGVERTNIIRNIKDYGFNLGGPLFVDRAWWWLAVGAQDIKTTNLYGVDDDTLIINYSTKLNVQIIPENRFELFATVSQKEKWGRDATYSFPGGFHQTGRYYFGWPILKVQDEHMFGNDLFLSAKYSYADSGFNMIPMDDEDRALMVNRNVEAGIWEDSYWSYICGRPVHQMILAGSYFNDALFGASHEMKFGFEYASRSQESSWETSGGIVARYNYHTTSVDIDGDNNPDIIPEMRRFEYARQSLTKQHIDGYAAYLSDTITFGRFNFILGLRYDYQKPSIPAYTIMAVDDNQAWTDNVSPAAIAAMDRFMPGFEIPDIKPDYSWNVLSPRVGFTYDLFGDSKTILKGSWAMYGDFMGTGMANNFRPVGYGGYANYWWYDAPSLGGNGNGIVDITELYWTEPGDYTGRQVYDADGNFLVDYWNNEEWMWGGFNPDDPQQADAPRYTMDPSHGSNRTNEFIVTLEREVVPDFGVALDFTYRRIDNFNWSLRWDGENEATIQSQDWYVPVGDVPADMDGFSGNEATGTPYYLWKDDPNVSSWYSRYSTQRPDYYRDYRSVELRFNKRLSHKWMLSGSATYQMQKVHFGEKGYLDPTSHWALDNNVYSHSMGGGSGKISMDVFPRWMFKVSGLYQFPLDINASFTFNAREGHIVPWTIGIVDYDAPNPRDTRVGDTNLDQIPDNVFLEKYGKLRLPNFWNINLRVEKVIRAGDSGRIYLMADIFNLFNLAHENRRYDKHHGMYYVHSGSTSLNATDYQLNEILNPRILRFGIRFQY
jgi:hypothetical protein